MDLKIRFYGPLGWIQQQVFNRMLKNVRQAEVHDGTRGVIQIIYFDRTRPVVTVSLSLKPHRLEVAGNQYTENSSPAPNLYLFEVTCPA